MLRRELWAAVGLASGVAGKKSMVYDEDVSTFFVVTHMCQANEIETFQLLEDPVILGHLWNLNFLFLVPCERLLL